MREARISPSRLYTVQQGRRAEPQYRPPTARDYDTLSPKNYKPSGWVMVPKAEKSSPKENANEDATANKNDVNRSMGSGMQPPNVNAANVKTAPVPQLPSRAQQVTERLQKLHQERQEAKEKRASRRSGKKSKKSSKKAASPQSLSASSSGAVMVEDMSVVDTANGILVQNGRSGTPKKSGNAARPAGLPSNIVNKGLAGLGTRRTRQLRHANVCARYGRHDSLSSKVNAVLMLDRGGRPRLVTTEAMPKLKPSPP